MCVCVREQRRCGAQKIADPLGFYRSRADTRGFDIRGINTKDGEGSGEQELHNSHTHTNYSKTTAV